MHRFLNEILSQHVQSIQLWLRFLVYNIHGNRPNILMPTLSELENMPPNLDERNREILSQISSISETPIIGTPTTTPSDLTSYDSDSGIQLNSASAVVYEKINIPIEQNLKELLVSIIPSALSSFPVFCCR